MNVKNIFLVLVFSFSSLTLLAAATQVTQQTENEKKFVEIDISGSAGNYNGKSYTEIHAGINLNFTDWLTWRNSVFKRTTSGSASELTGLDSSLRFFYDIDPIHFYAGPGYRFTSESDKNALVGEAGASINAGPISLGAGAKYLRYDKAQFDAVGTELKRDDLSYFISISGGAGWKF